MATTTEKRALGFFAGVLLLGAGVRAVGASGTVAIPPDARSRSELHRQIQAVDSARRAGTGRRQSRRRNSAATRASGGEPGGPATPRPTRGGSVWQENAAPVPVYYLRETRPERPPFGDDAGARGVGESTSGVEVPVRVDVDVATEAELERLPRIGPALARRIVADRDTRGPYGSLEELTRVSGIGPAIAKRIAPYVTFTLTPRPSREGEAAARVKRGGAGRRLRKPRAP